MTTTNNNRNFSQGKIYRIEPVCEFEEGDIYIGSTTQDLLCKRLRNHRAKFKCWKKGKGNNVTSFTLFDKYGVDNCKIVLIENVDASNLDELKSREAYYIRTLKCVNKIIPLRTKAEYRKDNEQKIKEYFEKNKEKISERHKGYAEKGKEYREKNKEKISERHKGYAENNKEKISERQKEYYEANKEVIREKHNQYYEANKEAILEKQKQRRLKKEQEKLDNLNNTVVVDL